MTRSDGDAGEPVGSRAADDSVASSAAEPQLRTFLIADIRGYTRFTQSRGDEAAALLASRFAELVFAGVASRGGRLLELRGDEALVVFGSARHALTAAVELQQQFAEECASEPSLPLRVGIGVDAGEAVPVGEGYRGAALNRAARLCSHAGAGEVLASDAVVHLAGPVEGLRFVQPEPLRLKGLEQPLGVVRVVPGALSRWAAWSWRARRGLVRFRRSRVVWAGAAALALAAVAVGALVQRSSAPHAFKSVAPNSVAMLDSAGRIRYVATVGASPSHAAVGFGSLWVTNFEDDNVSRVDLKTHLVQQTIPVGHGPTAVAVGDGSVWVVNGLDGTLSRIDPRTQREVEHPHVGNRPSGIVFAGGSIWVALAADQRVVRFDPRSSHLGGHVDLQTSPEALAAGAGALWASSPEAGVVYRIELARGHSTIDIPVGTGASGLAFGFGSLWVANTSDGTVSRIDPARNLVLAAPAVGNTPTALAVTEAGIWVTNRYGHSVALIDPAKNGVVRRTSLGAEPETIAAMGSTVWVGVQAGPGAHRGGTFTTTDWYIDSIDPALGYSVPGWPVSSVVYDGLLGYARSGGGVGTQLVPDLAVAVPRPSADLKSYRFELRRGIRYSDGTPVRPSDLRRGFERLFRLGSPAPGSGYYTTIVGAASCRPTKPCDLSRGIVADDRAGTVTFYLTAPDGDFLHTLAMPFAAAVPASAGRRAATSRHPIPGTGPYRIVPSADVSTRLVLVRNRFFREWSHGAQPDGFPDRLAFRAGPQSKDPAYNDPAIAQVLSGRADAVMALPTLALLHEVKTRYPTLLHAHLTTATYAFFLNTHERPFDDIRVRRALNFAIDRRRMTQRFGFTTTACQLFPRNVPGYVPYCPYTSGPKDGAWHGPDLARARRLVKASGTAGMRITFWTPPPPVPVARLVVATLRQLGYDAHLKVVSHKAHGQDLSAPRTHMQAGHFYTAFPDFLFGAGLIDATYRCVPGAPLQYGYRDAAVCSLMRRARDLAARGREREANVMWTQADHALVDRAPFLAYGNPPRYDVVSRRVGHYQFNPLYGTTLGQAWVR